MGLGANRVRTSDTGAEGISYPVFAVEPPFCYSNAQVSPRLFWLSLEAATMKLLLDRLTASPTPYRFETAPGWWRAAQPARHGLPAEPSEPFAVELLAHLLGEDVYLEGSILGTLEFECSRCLARYRHALHEPFRLILEPAGSRVPAEPEGDQALARDGMCLGEESETGWFRGEEIDLGAFVLEAISLSLPVQPLCREDCPGLCPRCGAELARGACGCEERKPESPFAVLGTLRLGSSGGRS